MTGPDGGRRELEPGTRIGEYRILRLLGRGGMGVVYEAEDVTDGRLVALKTLHDGLDADAGKRFLREGLLAASVSHPNAVYVYGTAEVDGTPIIIMELVDGGNLEERVAKNGPLPINEAVAMVVQLIDGLEAAHAVGVLHRDVKPSNCFVDTRGTVKIGDFGLSRPADADELSRLTQTSQFLGTPAFSAPEQLLGEGVDIRSDIYSVGATLYWLLTGRHPYQATNSVQLVAAVLNGNPTSIRAWRPEVPAELDGLALRCLARKPADRIGDYSALRAALAGTVAIAPPAGLGIRLGALLVDFVALMLLVFIGEAAGIEIAAESVMATVGEIAAVLLWFGLPEAVFGRSMGKAIFGLRVVGRSGLIKTGPALVRAAAFFGAFEGSDWLAVAAGLPETDEFLLILLVVVPLLLFATARRHNGFAGLHDLLTATRVVRVPPTPAHSRLVARQLARGTRLHAPVAFEAAGDAVAFGPFRAAALPRPLRDGTDLFEAVDPRLSRPIWIHKRQAGTPPLPPGRRDVARPGRLRWVGGRRTASESWDAYEAVPGRPLVEAFNQAGQDWALLRSCLVDLAQELQHADADGAPGPLVSMDHLWLADDGRVLILDFTLGTSESAPTSDPADLLNGVVDAFSNTRLTAPASRRPSPPAPAHLRTALNLVRRKAPLADISRALAGTLGQPVGITRSHRRRSVLWCLAPSALVLTAGLTTWWLSRLFSDAETRTLSSLVDYVNTLEGDETPDSSDASNRRIAEVFLAARLAPFLADSAIDRPGVGIYMDRGDWEAAGRIAARHPTIDSAEARNARRVVTEEWQGARPDGRTMLQTLLRGVLVAMAVPLILVALLSIATAATVRRGPILHKLALDIDGYDGNPAGRARVLARSLLTWAPIVILIGALGAEASPTVERAALGAASLVGLVSLIDLIRTQFAPARSLAERLSRTWLVPE